MSSKPQEARGTDSRIGRRTFVKGIGGAAAAGVGLAHSNGAVQETEAIAPAVVGAAAVGALAARTAVTLRDISPLASEDPVDGLGPEALISNIYEGGLTRDSTIQSTFTDNQNIIQSADHVAYTEAKIAAIEELNDGASQEEVEDAAVDAIEDHHSTILSNLYKSWSEAATEYKNFAERMMSSDSYEFHEFATEAEGNAEPILDINTNSRSTPNSDDQFDVYTETEEVTLPNGDTMDAERLHFYFERSGDDDHINFDANWLADDWEQNGGDYYTWFDDEWRYADDMDDFADGRPYLAIPDTHDSFGWDDVFVYSRAVKWEEVVDDLADVFDDVNDGMLLWVDEVYGDVQSGDIDIEDLITPRERAAMLAEEESMAKAIADLQALNIPIDVEREATVHLSEYDATLRGTIGMTSGNELESGVTYDPDDLDGDVYLTYDVSEGSGTWGAYEEGIDGGEVTFTDEPFPETIYRIETTAGETVQIHAEDLEEIEDGGAWTVDISDDLEDPITEIEEVRYYADVDETQNEMIRLSDEFTIEHIENNETGEEEESLTYESSEPQDDENYITQEEWDELEQQNQELIEKYEDSQSEGLLGGGFGDWGGFGDLEDAGLVTVAVGGAIVLGAVGILRQAIAFYLPGK